MCTKYSSQILICVPAALGHYDAARARRICGKLTIIKNRRAHGRRRTPLHHHFFQGGTAGKRTIFYALQIGRQGDSSQRRGSRKCRIPYFRHGFRDADSPQSAAAAKSIVRDSDYAVHNLNFLHQFLIVCFSVNSPVLHPRLADDNQYSCTVQGPAPFPQGGKHGDRLGNLPLGRKSVKYNRHIQFKRTCHPADGIDRFKNRDRHCGIYIKRTVNLCFYFFSHVSVCGTVCHSQADKRIPQFGIQSGIGNRPPPCGIYIGCIRDISGVKRKFFLAAIDRSPARKSVPRLCGIRNRPDRFCVKFNVFFIQEAAAIHIIDGVISFFYRVCGLIIVKGSRPISIHKPVVIMVAG